MDNTPQFPTVESPADTIALARKCLRLIRDIADRGASAWNTENVGFALQELTQVLLERTGIAERLFEPIPADQISDLHSLYAELEFVECFSQSWSEAKWLQ